MAATNILSLITSHLSTASLPVALQGRGERLLSGGAIETANADGPGQFAAITAAGKAVPPAARFAVGATSPSTRPPVSYHFIPQGDTLEAPIPCTIVVDSGRQVLVDRTISGAIFDHHQIYVENPKNADSAASLVYKGREDILAIRNQVTSIVAHNTPDLDAVTAMAIAGMLVERGPLPDNAAGFVDYVRLSDNAAYDGTENLDRSLAIVVQTLIDMVKSEITSRYISSFNEGRDPAQQIKGPWQLPPDEATILKGLIDHAIAKVGTAFVTSLLDHGYDPMLHKGELTSEDVPQEWHDYFHQAQENARKDLEIYQREKRDFVYLRGINVAARSGDGKTTISLAVSQNTQSLFFPYLYAQGVAGGVICHEAQNDDVQQSLARVVIGVNPNQNIDISALGKKLNEREIAKRKEIGLNTTPPAPDSSFFKVVSNGTLIISYGPNDSAKPGTITLTSEEIAEVIRSSG